MEAPEVLLAVDPRLAATPAEVQAILAEVTQIRPELTAFFGCLAHGQLPALLLLVRCI
jgi:hypothetical protein